MVWYGMQDSVGWYDKVWYGAVRCCVVRCGVVRYGAVWYGMRMVILTTVQGMDGMYGI